MSLKKKRAVSVLRGRGMNTLSPENLRLAYELMNESKRILIVAHQKPDGDTSGSSLTLLDWLQGQGKVVNVFCLHKVPEQLSFLPNTHLVKNDPALFEEEWDLIIACDSGDLQYAGVQTFIDCMKKKPKIINFDHHASNKLFGDVNLVNIIASSTAEVVYQFLQENKIAITKSMAICLMTGVFTDTGGFSNAATNKQALEMAAHFVKKGASIPEIHRATIANKSISVMKFWGTIMSRIKQTGQGIAYTYILRQDFIETGIDPEEIDGLSNYLSQLNDARAVIVFSERDGGKVKASMRTYHNDVDLALLATSMGGGGHKKSAGFTVDGRIQEFEDGIKII